ncbi:hypothetical protein FRC08_016037 [Ceratobasidium sp. 394]|nr:hypothetical protein FRC08_016037 [Ceratobasidium sp. 394]
MSLLPGRLPLPPTGIELVPDLEHPGLVDRITGVHRSVMHLHINGDFSVSEIMRVADQCCELVEYMCNLNYVTLPMRMDLLFLLLVSDINWTAPKLLRSYYCLDYSKEAARRGC